LPSPPPAPRPRPSFPTRRSSDLRYRGEPLKAIKSFDSAGQVVLLNSFSKTLSPGIRVGCAFGRQDIIRKMTIAKQSADTHTSNLDRKSTRLNSSHVSISYAVFCS